VRRRRACKAESQERALAGVITLTAFLFCTPALQGWEVCERAHEAGPCKASPIIPSSPTILRPSDLSSTLCKEMSKMSAACAPHECASLQSITSFATYVGCMRKVTSQNLTVSAMAPCREQICSSLYGIGNADISGIGVSKSTGFHLHF
jgi:hypothetical protein